MNNEKEKIKFPLCKEVMERSGDAINVQVYLCLNDDCEVFTFSKFYTVEAKKFGDKE